MVAGNSFMRIWKFMEMSEKQRLIQHFLKQHGEQFTKDDFIKFLASRYDHAGLDSMHGLHNPGSSRRRAR